MRFYSGESYIGPFVKFPLKNRIPDLFSTTSFDSAENSIRCGVYGCASVGARREKLGQTS
jgi:hypothetical protein